MMPEEEVLLSLSTNRYFPLDQLFDAVKELQLDSVTVAVDEDGLHSMSLDYEHYRYFEWHAHRLILDCPHYELKRPFTFSIDNITARPYFAALMRAWDKLSIPYATHEIKVYQRGNKTFFAASFYDFEFAVLVNRESVTPRPMKELQFRAHARIYTDELSEALKKLKKYRPDVIRLTLDSGRLDISAMKRDSEVGFEVIYPTRYDGEATACYDAADFMRLCKIMSRYTSVVRLEFANNYPVKIEAAYVPGVLTFVLAPNIPGRLRHEPHSP